MPERVYDFDREMARSSTSARKRECWGWVVVRSFDEPFFVRDIARELGSADSVVAPHVSALQGLSLVERTVSEYRTPFAQPLQKLPSDLWVPIQEALESIDPTVLIPPAEK